MQLEMNVQLDLFCWRHLCVCIQYTCTVYGYITCR